MKILHLIDVPWDSGITHYALILAQAQKKKGHTVYIAGKPGEKPWLKAQRLGLRTVPLVQPKSLNVLRTFLKKHRIEILNAHTGSTHSLAVAAALGQKVAVVRTRADARSVKSNIGTRFIFGRTQRVIAAADYIRQAYLREIKLPSRKVVTIHQGIESADFALQPPPKKPVLGIVARLDPVKGHRYLIGAVRLIRHLYPDLKVRVMGQEENIKTKELVRLVERLRVEDQFTFEGFKKDVPTAMAECSIGVIASTGSEAVSRAALEWMSAGRPVVATEVGCLPELVKDQETGFLVEPNSSPALARALAALLHEPARAVQMGEAARERVKKEFNIQDFVDATIKVYRDALQEVK